MSRKFDERQMQEIKQKLLEIGRTRFSRYGFRKTGVEELAKDAGIAAGTFYKFYRSKEELFFDLMEAEERTIRDRLMSGMTDGVMTAGRFETFMLEAFALIADNPILSGIMRDRQLETIASRVPPERLARNLQDDNDLFLPIVKRWQAEGALAEIPPEHIVSMIRSIVLLSLHRQEIGESVYDDTIRLLIRTVARGLFGEERLK